MTHLKKFTVLAGLVGLCASPNLRAEIASGSYTNTFSYTNVPIWDISGTYNADVSGSGFDFTINMDKAGNFNGGGFISAGGLTNVDLTFWGSVRNGASNVTRVIIGLRLKGSMDLGTQGGKMSFRATVIEKLEVDAATGTMIGTMGGSASASIMGRTVSQRIPVTDVPPMSLPVGMTGNWQLALNVETNRNHYAGDGTVTLSNGKTIPVVAAGSYAPRTDISRLVIASVPGTTNGIVRLGLTSTVAGGQIEIQRLVGRVLGQTLRSVSP